MKEQFKEYGEIERVALARNMSKARRNDFGFVNFTTHEAAVACANGVNDTELGDGRSKVSTVLFLLLNCWPAQEPFRSVFLGLLFKI